MITHWIPLLLVAAGMAWVAITAGEVPGTGLAMETGKNTIAGECVPQVPPYRPNYPAIKC
jgi:hypothetical protein